MQSLRPGASLSRGIANTASVFAGIRPSLASSLADRQTITFPFLWQRCLCWRDARRRSITEIDSSLVSTYHHHCDSSPSFPASTYRILTEIQGRRAAGQRNSTTGVRFLVRTAADHPSRGRLSRTCVRATLHPPRSTVPAQTNSCAYAQAIQLERLPG